MKSKLNRILVIALSFELLLSSIGVAQVSHLCKMAMAGMEATSCASEDADQHACCDDLANETSAPEKSESCCTDQVRYFHNQVNCTVHSLIKSLPVHVAEFILPYPLFSIAVSHSEISAFQNVEYPPGETGQQIFISIQSLRI